MTAASLGAVDPFGDLPAPITNPEAWPPNYADGWNDAVRHMADAFPLVRAKFAALTPAAGGADYTAELAERCEVAAALHTLQACGPAVAQLTAALPKLLALFPSALAAPAPPPAATLHTRVNHEREPHCIGCWVITDTGWEALEAVCNECGERRDLATALSAPPPADAVRALVGERLRYLERFSDDGQHMKIPGPSAGDAWHIAQDLRSAFAALSAAPADGCGACGDGCQGRGACRLAEDSPPAAAPTPEGGKIPQVLLDAHAEAVKWSPKSFTGAEAIRAFRVLAGDYVGRLIDEAQQEGGR